MYQILSLVYQFLCAACISTWFRKQTGSCTLNGNCQYTVLSLAKAQRNCNFNYTKKLQGRSDVKQQETVNITELEARSYRAQCVSMSHTDKTKQRHAVKPRGSPCLPSCLSLSRQWGGCLSACGGTEPSVWLTCHISPHTPPEWMTVTAMCQTKFNSWH